MRFLLDFFPIALFVVAYKLHNIYVATAVLMAATVVQTGVIYAVDKRLQTLHKVTLGMILIFGSLTLILQDDRFVKWKPTVLYGAMALVLTLALVFWKKNLLRVLLSSHFELPEKVWTKLTVLWIGFFIFLAAANAYVYLNYSEDFWVEFKLWGFGFWIPFMIVQGLMLAPHLKLDEEDDNKGPETPELPENNKDPRP